MCAHVSTLKYEDMWEISLKVSILSIIQGGNLIIILNKSCEQNSFRLIPRTNINAPGTKPDAFKLTLSTSPLK